MTRDEIFERVRELLTKTFGLPAEKVTPKALLQQDLDLDSIDAVDLVVYLQDWTGR
jgi:acyl carrier protein